MEPVCSWNNHTNFRKYDSNIIIPGNSAVSRFARLFERVTQTTIEVDKPGLTPAQRENDKHIMDHVLELKKFSRVDLKRINYRILILDVQTVSDIATACGNILSREHTYTYDPKMNRR